MAAIVSNIEAKVKTGGEVLDEGRIGGKPIEIDGYNNVWSREGEQGGGGCKAGLHYL